MTLSEFFDVVVVDLHLCNNLLGCQLCAHPDLAPFPLLVLVVVKAQRAQFCYSRIFSHMPALLQAVLHSASQADLLAVRQDAV
jgi:hypothetical protein